MFTVVGGLNCQSNQAEGEALARAEGSLRKSAHWPCGTGRGGETADTEDLKSSGGQPPCGFESRPRHHVPATAI